MDQQCQPTIVTTQATANIKPDCHVILNAQPKPSHGQSQSEVISVTISEVTTVKREDDTANKAESSCEGTVVGAEEMMKTAGQVTDTSTQHQASETAGSQMGKRSGDKGDGSPGESTVLRRNMNRRCRKNQSQEEPPKRRRSLRRAREEDLEGLRVQFGDGADKCVDEEESVPQTRTKRKRQSSQPKGQESQTVKAGAGRRGRKPRQTTCTVDIGSDVLEQWRRIGTERSLGTDADIASFLVWHFCATDVKPCATCQTPLQLLCPYCPPSTRCASPTPTSAASSPSPPCPEASPKSSPLPPSQPSVKEESREEEEEEGEEEILPSEPEEPVKQRPRRGRKRKVGSQSHVCSDCGATFVRAAALKVHTRKHTGEKPFSCSECDRSFTTSGQLVNHRRKHTGERPYTCTVCNATFPIASSLKQHSRIHTGDRPYACHVCQQRFCYRGDLTAHVRKHTGDRPFLCSDCGKSFTMSSHLSKHKRIHSGYRPFECNVCHKTFPFLNRLTLHMRTHTGEKPFLCADCGSSFIRASTLTIHRRIHHTFEKPCICPYCQHAFADSANLSKHKKNKHGAQKMTSKPPSSNSSTAQLAGKQPTSAINPGQINSMIELAEPQSSTAMNPGQLGSVTQLAVKQSPSTRNPGQMGVEEAVTSVTVVESGDRVYGEAFTLQASGAVVGSDGLVVTNSDGHGLHELKPVGPWKTFSFPV